MTSKLHRERDVRRVGLARALSKLGYCSRSHAAALIRAGRVKLNEIERRDPEMPVHVGRDRIEVNGKLAAAARKIYFMMNKQRGVITTASDENARKTVYENLRDDLPWVAPVGRLDKASEGLLLLTNDSEWAARITVPETHLDKTYHVQVNAIVRPQDLQVMMHGMRTSVGETLRAKSAAILRQGERNTWLVIVLDEGRNRHIRRMLEQMGVEVLRLVRVAIGPLWLGDLAKGAYRALSVQEKKMLDRAMDTRQR
ncbi:MAG: pseudouridine synthase [Candidatus Acidiferrales bacterium]